jgi:CDP-glucose 4,6-dehydratase
VRDYFYVEDGAEAYMMLVEKLASDRSLAGEAFNFSYEVRLTVLDLVQRILDEMGSDLAPEVRNEASNEIRCQYLSAAKALARLDWRPAHDLAGGLQRTVAWYRRFFADKGSGSISDAIAAGNGT